MFENRDLVRKPMTQLNNEVPNKRIAPTSPGKVSRPICRSSGTSLRNQIRLVLLMSSLAGIWLVALPWIARQPQMAAHLQWLEDQGIDGGAMYYTELEAMEPILERLERRR